jgi:hypothetical protein
LPYNARLGYAQIRDDKVNTSTNNQENIASQWCLMPRLIVPDSDGSGEDFETLGEHVTSQVRSVARQATAAREVIAIKSDNDEDLASACRHEDTAYDFLDDTPTSSKGETTRKKRKREVKQKERKSAHKSKERVTSSDEEADLIDLGASQARLELSRKPKHEVKPVLEGVVATKSKPKVLVKARPRLTIDDFCAQPSLSSSSDPDEPHEDTRVHVNISARTTDEALPTPCSETAPSQHEMAKKQSSAPVSRQLEAVGSLLTPVSPKKSKQTTAKKASEKVVVEEVKPIIQPEAYLRSVSAQAKEASTPASHSQQIHEVKITLTQAKPIPAAKPVSSPGLVMNYAATRPIALAQKPRMATGLSRRQRVESLHKFIRR